MSFFRLRTSRCSRPKDWSTIPQKGRRARNASAPNRGGLHPLHGDVGYPPTRFSPSVARSLRGRGTPGRVVDRDVVNDNALRPDNEGCNVGLHLRLRTSHCIRPLQGSGQGSLQLSLLNICIAEERLLEACTAHLEQNRRAKTYFMAALRNRTKTDKSRAHQIPSYLRAM